MTEDLVSIIFVHYAMSEERSQLARASLKLLQGTIHTPTEIIVVDNGSNEEDSQFFLNQCQQKKISLYIRNADNMHFAYARNQGMRSATGNWIGLVDNDIMYRDTWLEQCMWSITKFPNEKRLASPINYPYVHSRDPRWRHGQYRLNGRIFNVQERAGSNCLVMTRKAMEEIGYFNIDKGARAGSDYTDRWVNLGYLVITPGVNFAFDAGLRRGFDFSVGFSIDKTLSDGSKLNIKKDETN